MRPDLNQLLREFEEYARRFRELLELAAASAGTDWFELFATGEILTTSDAGRIAGLSSEQIRKRCVQTAEVGQPIGVQTPSTWLVSKKRLLEDIEEYQGRHNRLVAETRAKKMLETLAIHRGTPEND